MNSRISLFLFPFVSALFILPVEAQKLKKADQAIIAHLSTHVNHLSESDLAGEKRENLAIEYICSQFKLTGIEPKGDSGTWLHSFEIPEGMEISPATCLFINGEEIKNDGFFPLLMSPSVNLEASPSLSLQEADEPWFLDLKEILEDSISHNIKSYIASKAAEVKKKGCTALFIYNTSDIKDGIIFDGKESAASLPLPVVYIFPSVAKKHFSDETAMLDIKLKIAFFEKKHTGKYIVGFINNNAPKTIMIGTNESADNAAALIEIGNLLKNSPSKNNNYLLVAFFDKHGIESGLPATGNDIARQSPGENYMIDVSGTAVDAEKLNYIYTLVEKTK